MAPKPKIPKADHEAIRRLRKSHSVIEIAAMYGVTRQAIYKILWGQVA